MSTADTVHLPAHARVIANENVWMEGDAIVQFARVAERDGCIAAAAMPDLHAGTGIPVGAVFAFADRIIPQLIGSDAGCGVRLMITATDGISTDALQRRVLPILEGASNALDGEGPLSNCDRRELFLAVWNHGAAGLAQVPGVDEKLAAIAAAEPEISLTKSADPAPFLHESFEDALGTVGGGNHFVEIAKISHVHDRQAAKTMGLKPGMFCVLAHSGSRGLGAVFARRYWESRGLLGDDIQLYLSELAGVCRFAQANRLVLAYSMLRALSAARTSKIALSLDFIHNDVSKELVKNTDAWVHRKGAAPARGSDFTVVLGSRGAPSWLMRSLDNESGLRSVAHGAGRRMGRGEALSKLKSRYTRSEATRNAYKGVVICDDPALVFEEHPDAYKPIAPVVDSLCEARMAEPVCELVPVITVKR